MNQNIKIEYLIELMRKSNTEFKKIINRIEKEIMKENYTNTNHKKYLPMRKNKMNINSKQHKKDYFIH